MICKILGLFVNTLTGNVKYSLLNIDNLTQPIQMQLTKKKETLVQYYVLRKAWLCKCLKVLFSEDLLTSSMLNGAKHCLNLHSSTFNIFTDQYSILTTFSWEKYFLVISKILGQFDSTLTADDKYSLVNRDNLMQPIQM